MKMVDNSVRTKVDELQKHLINLSCSNNASIYDARVAELRTNDIQQKNLLLEIELDGAKRKIRASARKFAFEKKEMKRAFKEIQDNLDYELHATKQMLAQEAASYKNLQFIVKYLYLNNTHLREETLRLGHNATSVRLEIISLEHQRNAIKVLYDKLKKQEEARRAVLRLDINSE
jgi:hypothetical protein